MGRLLKILVAIFVIILFNVIISILINVANVKEIMEYIHLVIFLNMLVLMYVLLPERSGNIFNIG